MKYVCKTLFDCSATGITGHFKIGQVPFRDRTGQTINNISDWNRARNQQRNFETLLQLISLRSQPEILHHPQKIDKMWQFSFEVESAGTFELQGHNDAFAALYRDCDGVPMVTGLDEHSVTDKMLRPQKNIWFESINN